MALEIVQLKLGILYQMSTLETIKYPVILSSCCMTTPKRVLSGRTCSRNLALQNFNGTLIECVWAWSGRTRGQFSETATPCHDQGPVYDVPFSAVSTKPPIVTIDVGGKRKYKVPPTNLENQSGATRMR